MQFHFCSKNGQILPIEQATISLANIAYSYGFGVYETLKVRNNTLYFVNQHIDRLFASAAIIDLDHPFTKKIIKQYIADLVKYEKADAGNVKVLLIGGNTKENAELFILLLAPLFPDRKLYTQGAKTITTQYERLFPNAKTLNMLGSYLAYKKAHKHGCYDALLLDQSGNILEGTRTNFFAIKDTTLVTPVKEKVLEGVTRDTVMYVAKKNGFEINETDIPLAEIKHYDGAFITSTSTKIMPINQIDDTILQIPDELKKLMKLYEEFLDNSKGVFIE